MRHLPAALALAALCAAAQPALAATPAAGPAPAAAYEPKLEPGTTIEIGVAGVNDYRYKVPVNTDGYITIPLLEPIYVRDMTLAQLRERVKAELPRQPHKTRSVDGHEGYTNFQPNEISVEVAEWRPIYVDGDVARGGELPFRPGMTVRQAVAMAGGLDLLHSRVQNPYIEDADIQAEYASSWMERAKLQAQVMGIKASIEGKPLGDVRAQLKAPPSIKPQQLDRIAAQESARFRAFEDDYAKEAKSLDAQVQEADRQVQTVVDQLATSTTMVKMEQADYDRIKALFDKNIVPINRLSDEQRQLGFVQDRQMQVTASLGQARLNLQEYKRKREALPDQRKLKLLGDLQDVELRLQAITARIGGLDKKLIYTGAAKSQLSRGLFASPSYFISRREDGKPTRFAVLEDEPVRSGDVIEIVLPNPMAALD